MPFEKPAKSSDTPLMSYAFHFKIIPLIANTLDTYLHIHVRQSWRENSTMAILACTFNLRLYHNFKSYLNRFANQK